MTKEQLIKKIAREYSVDEIDVSNYFESIFETINAAFIKNKNVNISEFGKFVLRTKTGTGGIKTKTISFSPSKKFALEINYNFSDLVPVKIKTLDEKSLREEYYEPTDADEVILIESEGDVVDNEIDEKNDFLFSQLSENLKSRFLNEHFADDLINNDTPRVKTEVIPGIPVGEKEIPEISAPEQLTREQEENKIGIEPEDKNISSEENIPVVLIPEEVINGENIPDTIIPEEIITEKGETELSEPEPLTVKSDDTVQEETQKEDFTTFTRQKETSSKAQTVFSDAEMLLIELKKIKEKEKDKIIYDKIDEEKKQQDIIDEQDPVPVISDWETVKSKAKIRTEEEKALEEELERMLEEREKILTEIKQLESDSQKIIRIESLINAFSKTSDDLLKVSSKPVKPKKEFTIEENVKAHDESFEDKLRSLLEPSVPDVSAPQDVFIQPDVSASQDVFVPPVVITPQDVSDLQEESTLPDVSAPPDSLKSFDISDLNLPQDVFIEESEDGKKDIENAEMKIFDKLIEEHFASEPPEIKPDRSLELLEEQYDNLIKPSEQEPVLFTPEKQMESVIPEEPEAEIESFEEKKEDLSRFLKPDTGLDSLKEQFDDLTITEKPDEIIIPERLEDAFVNIELPEEFSKAERTFFEKDKIEKENAVRNYNDIFKSVESYKPKAVQPAKITEEPKKTLKKKKSMKKLIIPIIILLILGVIIIVMSRPNPSALQDDVLVTTGTNENKTDANKNEKNSDAESIKTKDVPADVDKIIYEDNGVYFKQNSLGVFIQVGTYLSEKEAKIKAFLLKTQKFNADVEKISLGKNDFRYRVKIGPYPDLDAAKASFETMKK
jgi:nucleoid DNA-binding protein